MKRILVPVDFSNNSIAALKYATELAVVNDAQIYVLHVTFMPTFYSNELTNYSYFDKGLQSSIERIKNISISKLDEFTKTYIPESKDIIKKVTLGYSIYIEIINFANKIKADLIIMGTHSAAKGTLSKIGSNTERVIRSSEIPVIAHKKKISAKKIKKVVFASDFEKDARNVYPFLNIFIKPYNSEVHLLYINTKSNFREYDEIKAQILRFKKHFYGDFKMIVRASKNIDEGIIRYANSIKADLIALGVKRRKGLSLYLTDRITEGVISKTEIPVLSIDNPQQ